MVARRALALASGHAIVAGRDHVLVVDTRGSAPALRLDMPGVCDVAVVGDEVWVVAAEPAVLHRFQLATGDRAAPPRPLPGHGGALRPIGFGAPAALWTASPASMITADGRMTEIAGEWDCIVPVSISRWLGARQGRIVLRNGTTERWNVAGALATSRVVDGAVLFDGRSAALVVAHGAILSQLLVVGLHDGAIQLRVTLTGIDLVRFAPARGYALFASGGRKLMFFDLRFGRMLKDHVEARDVIDVTLDTAAQAFIVRYSDRVDDVALFTLDDIMALPRLPADVAPQAPLVVPAPALQAPTPPPPVVDDFHRGDEALGALAALSPRPHVVHQSPIQAASLLERYRELVASVLGRAIALGWDSSRIAFPNENHLPFHAEVRGILGRAAGRAVEDVTDSEHRVLAATAAAREAEALAAPELPPLTALATEFGLSPLARLLLLLIAGPTLWGELARLYGILGNDDQRPLVDEMLLVQLLQGQFPREAIARELDRDAPLIRHGFVRLGEGRRRPFIELSCDPILHRLLGAERDFAVEDLRTVADAPAFDDLLVPAAIKDGLVRAVGTAGARGRIVIRGRTGSGRHTMLATLARAANRTLAVIDATPMLRDLRVRIGQLRTALQRAHLLGFLPCVDGLETLPADDRVARDLVAAALDGHDGPLAIRLPPETQPILQPGYVTLDLPTLSLQQRTACWHLLLAHHRLHVREPDVLADRYGIGPGVIHRVCERVAGQRATTAAGADAGQALEIAIRQHLETGLRATATRVERLATWSRVVLPPDVQDSILELLARIKHRRLVYDVWGYDQVISTSRGVTALFQGGPGTGKTLVASAIANELGMDLYRVDLSRIMSKWIGETEQNLAKLFDAAEDGHAIILFDEADSLFAKRTEVKTSVDRYANLNVNYLLQRLDSFEGIAILTTNFGTSIDTAFKRRLSFRLTFPFPDEEAREALWRCHVSPGIPTAGVFDYADLAQRYRLSGGYIRNAAVRAAFLAAEEHVPLTHQHLERAIRAEFREIGKIAESGVLE